MSSVLSIVFFLDLFARYIERQVMEKENVQYDFNCRMKSGQEIADGNYPPLLHHDWKVVNKEDLRRPALYDEFIK